MKWSEEERWLLWEVWLDSVSEDSAGRVLAIATRAGELAAARGGTMTEERVREYIKEGSDLGEHIAAMGARIAVLEAAATKVAAELRHTYGHVALGQSINPDLVARAIRLLETATTGRHPCSPTCTHDDAATPGHSERVKKKREAVQRATSRDGRDEGYTEGAEAMRAVCLKDVREALANVGAWDRETERIVASAIEGATP